MKKKVSTLWFIEPVNAHTNEVIAKNLAALNQVDENFALTDVNGVEHSVFQIESHAFITRLYKDRQKFALKFNVFYRQGNNSLLRPWNFEENKKKKVENEKKKKAKIK
ncbi:MAG TPA: hypothetical protein VFD51_03160 [Patescibacteria group bacterium]|nr:hypothetical protein [Patescibacteria group bacterium]